VARLLQQLIEPPRTCSYLEDRQAQLEMMVLVDVSAAELEVLLARGYRHFGPVFFRPKCADCTECVTLRVVTREFSPSRSQRRAKKTASRFRREVGEPKVDAERLALYERWHASRERRRGWGENPVDAERYALDFAFPQPTAREVRFFDDAAGGKLVAIGIVDQMEHAASAVYFFYDPDIEHVSLGVAHIVMLIDDARRAGLQHVYLGYRVEGCASLAYKSRYEPYELLSGRPALDESPEWRRGR
jgi:arginine-tRNA-protein transferase